MRADYHVHTELSDDSVYPVENVVQDAISLGLDEIYFTDYADYEVKVDWDRDHPIRFKKIIEKRTDLTICPPFHIEERKINPHPTLERINSNPGSNNTQ